MANNTDNFFENNIFKYNSFSCDCAVDTVHITPNEPPQTTYKLQTIEGKKIRFAYAAKKGLVRIAANGTIEEANVLGTLIAVLDKKPSDLSKFFKSNGFLFPISDSTYEAIDSSQMHGIITRLKATVELMTAISEISKDYDKILHLMLYLIFAPQVKIQTELMHAPHTTYIHKIVTLLDNASNYTSAIDREKESFNKDTYTVADSILTPSYELDTNEYNDIVSGFSTSNHLYQNITQLYRNYSGSETERKTIDFLFHYFHEVGELSVLDGIVNYITTSKSENFTDDMKNTLLEVARYILGSEINANLSGIRPIYDAVSMTPSWNVDSLMSAIYFSLFYMKPDLELYRPCANPRCRNYFLVKTTTTQKKYCSTECCNRVTQDKYRKKKRETK